MFSGRFGVSVFFCGGFHLPLPWCFFVKVVAKEAERKERLQYEQTKLAATVKEVKEAKKTHEAISGECMVMTAIFLS